MEHRVGTDHGDQAGWIDRTQRACPIHLWAAQRRSLIYVGPSSLRTPGDSRPPLFTADRVRDRAAAAGVEVNVLIAGSATGGLARLARDTGGQAFSANDGVDSHVGQLRDRQPVATAGADAHSKSTDSPDIPLLVALLAAATVLAVWPVVRRR